MNAVLQVESPKDAARRLAASALKGPFQSEGLHVYCDANNEPAFYRWRARRANGEKVIRPMHWSGVEFVPGEPPAPAMGKLLYRLPELVAADPAIPVWIVEGEKCADALARLGLVSTTSGSADSAGAADWSPLKGRACVIWPDHDKPGARYADAGAERLRALGCAVEIIDAGKLALPDKGDCVDWLAQHEDATAADVDALERIQTPDARKLDSTFGVELIDAATLKPEPVRWLWPGWLARGKLHVLAGAPGTGKTTLAMDFAACVSAGRALPSGHRPQRGNVVIWSGEDDPADTLVPRLLAAGADLSRIKFVGDVLENGERYPFDPSRDVDKLAAAAAALDGVALLIVDPLVSAVSGDSHKNAEVRRGLAPLVDLAVQLDAALVGITHYSKGTQGREPLERVSGSLAFGALARVVLGTVRAEADGDDAPAKMMLARCKSNIGPDGGGFTYAFEQTELLGHAGLIASRIAWGAAVDGTARELLAEAEPDRDGADDAGSFLRDLLAYGSRPAKEVFAEAGAAGYSRDAMHRAKRKIGAEAVKAGMSGGWVWRLPPLEGSAEGSEDGAQNRPPPSPSSGARPPSSGDGAEAFEL